MSDISKHDLIRQTTVAECSCKGQGSGLAFAIKRSFCSTPPSATSIYKASRANILMCNPMAEEYRNGKGAELHSPSCKEDGVWET